MIVSWFSAGVSSAVALWLARDEADRVLYVDIDDHHEDNRRFAGDVATWTGKNIETLRSARFSSVEQVILAASYINGTHGAPCTARLKKQVRKQWEKANPGRHTYIWGFDASKRERERAEKIMREVPEHDHIFPLIDAGMDKAQAHGFVERMGVKRPVTYDMGLPNGNCIGCVKGGMGYWNLIRELFPDVFEARAKLERRIGASCINGKYLDELNGDEGRNEPVMAECGIICFLEAEK